MELSEKEKRVIEAKLIKAQELMAEAYNFIRDRDIDGESDLAIHVDSVHNDIDDTIDILKTV